MIDTEVGIGLEEIAVGAFVALFSELNAELAVIQAEKIEVDEMLAELRGLQPQPIELEPVGRSSFHLGHVPSLIADDSGWTPPLDWFPSASVMAYRANPSPGSGAWDQANSYLDSLYVEVIVKSSEHEGEEVCDRRIWRTVEAVNRVLMRNQTLGGIVTGLENPTAVVSEVFTRGESDENPENVWFWQAGRVDYGVVKFSPFE